MNIDMRALGGTPILAGALSGKAAFNRLIEKTMTEPAKPEPVFLDFSEVDVATASYLRESVLAFRDLVRGRRSPFYPVQANINTDIRDELMELMRARGDALLTCQLDARGQIANPVLIGELEPKQQITFDLVKKLGDTDAGELMRVYGEGLKNATAWNNRLANLASRGLLVEVSQGRAKRYRPLFKDA